MGGNAVTGPAQVVEVDPTTKSIVSSNVRAQLAVDLGISSLVPNTRTVAGKPLSSNVTLVKADVGLSNVDNTSDATKLAGTALRHYATGTPKAYPGRPVTTRPVVWASPDVAPPPPGTTSSGTGPVLDLDDVLLAPGVSIAT